MQVARPDFLIIAQRLATLEAGFKATGLSCEVGRILVVHTAQPPQPLSASRVPCSREASEYTTSSSSHVGPGKIERELMLEYTRLFESRMSGDYGVSSDMTSAEAIRSLKTARRFLEKVKTLL